MAKNFQKRISSLHPKNKHQGNYDFVKLIEKAPSLEPFVFRNKYNNLTIDFSDSNAVKKLNQALLLYFYKLDYWDIPSGFLTPPIPSRAEYIHQVAGLFERRNNKRCLDIGIGANAIYPIVGIVDYGWSFVGTEIDQKAIDSVKNLIEKNKVLQNRIELRKQVDSKRIFEGIVKPGDFFDITICNPPFHSSAEEARTGSLRKNRNLKITKKDKDYLNFSGQSNELWCDGGELAFISQMILESKKTQKSFRWFTTLISKEKHLKILIKNLKKVKPVEYKILPINIGNKTSRILAWSFIKEEFVPKKSKELIEE